ncbi:MAG: CoA-binding protein [Desulfobacterales bacterium]
MSKSITEELKPLFQPESIAIIGASQTEGKWGNMMVTRPVQSGYRGRIYPINPNAKTIYGLKAFPGILEVPETVDLAIFTIPAPMVPNAMKECVKKGVKAGVVISAGFAETGKTGESLQLETADIAKSGGIRFIGPNCMGFYSSSVRLNTAFAFMPEPGGISFVSQSGTMGGYLLENANNKGYGFHSFLSVGNQADLSMADYIDYFGDDEATKVIVLYIEGLKDARRFIEKARKTIKKKPIIVYKAGRTESGSRATMSHTASIAGSDAVFESACRQVGIIRTYDVIHAFDLAEALSKQPLPRGNRVAVVSGGGGHCVVSTDACGVYGLDVPELDAGTSRRISKLLLPHAPVPKNPIDMAADPRPSTLAKILTILAEHPGIDIIMASAPFFRNVFEPKVLQKFMDTVITLSEIPQKYGKPLLAMTHRSRMQGIFYEIMKNRDIPFYEFPEEAARAAYGLHRYSQIRSGWLKAER